MTIRQAYTPSRSFRTCTADLRPNGGNATISVFDTKTLKTIKKISVGKDPNFAFYDPKTWRVLGCHGDAAAITAIDPEKETVIGEIDLGGGAEAAVADGKATVLLVSRKRSRW